MRIFLLFFLILSFAKAQDDYNIQVLSVKNKSSITDEFIAKIKKSKMTYKTVEVDGWRKVKVGSFKDYKGAKKRLKLTKKCIAKDAFVSRNQTIIAKIEAIEIKEPGPQKELKNKSIKKPTCRYHHKYILDKNAKRKLEISQALSFYKNSSYYGFN